MSRTFKVFSAVAGLIALTGAVIGQQGAREIKFVGFAGSAGGFEARAKEFKKSRPDVNVKVQGVPANSWGELMQAITVNIAGGDVPDIADVATEGLRTFAANRVIAPVDDLLARDAAAMKATLADIHPNLLGAMKVGGRTYGLPTVWNTMVIYYNKKVLREAGVQPPTNAWTYDDFLRACARVTKGNTGRDDRWCYAFGNQYFLTLVPWMLRFGGNVLSDDWSRSRLNDPDTVAAVQALHDLVHKHRYAPKIDAGQSEQDLFVQGKLAFMGCGAWCVNGLKLAKFNPADYDVVYFPRVKTTRNVMGVGSAPIFAASKNKDAAWEFAKFLSGKTFQENFVVQDGWSTPSLRSAALKLERTPGFPKNGSIFYAAAANGVLVPAPQEYGLIEAALTREFGAAMANAKPVREAMLAAHKEVSDALARRAR